MTVISLTAIVLLTVSVGMVTCAPWAIEDRASDNITVFSFNPEDPGGVISEDVLDESTVQNETGVDYDNSEGDEDSSTKTPWRELIVPDIPDELESEDNSTTTESISTEDQNTSQTSKTKDFLESTLQENVTVFEFSESGEYTKIDLENKTLTETETTETELTDDSLDIQTSRSMERKGSSLPSKHFPDTGFSDLERERATGEGYDHSHLSTKSDSHKEEILSDLVSKRQIDDAKPHLPPEMTDTHSNIHSDPHSSDTHSSETHRASYTHSSDAHQDQSRPSGVDHNNDQSGQQDSEMTSDSLPDQAEFIDEDYGITEMRPRVAAMPDNLKENLSVTSEGSPDAMRLSDEVIIDALFTNLDILQDNIEMCEEGLRQRLLKASRQTGPETYSPEEASSLISVDGDDGFSATGQVKGVGKEIEEEEKKEKGYEVIGKQSKATRRSSVAPSQNHKQDIEDKMENGVEKGVEEKEAVVKDDVGNIPERSSIDPSQNHMKRNVMERNGESEMGENGGKKTIKKALGDIFHVTSERPRDGMGDMEETTEDSIDGRPSTAHFTSEEENDGGVAVEDEVTTDTQPSSHSQLEDGVRDEESFVHRPTDENYQDEMRVVGREEMEDLNAEGFTMDRFVARDIDNDDGESEEFHLSSDKVHEDSPISSTSSSSNLSPETQARKRRSANSIDENSTAFKDGNTGVKRQISNLRPRQLTHYQASHDVVMRLSNRLQYLKKSLEECYILFRQMEHIQDNEER